MIKVLARNLLLEIQESDPTYAGGFLVKPDEFRDISGKFILRGKADDCSTPIPIGAEVVIEMETEEVKRNQVELDGKKYFIIREDFAILYFEPEEEKLKENKNETSNADGQPVDNHFDT